MTDKLKTSETLKEMPSYPEINVSDSIHLKQLNSNQADQLFKMTEDDRDYLSKWLPWPKHTHSSADSLAFVESVAEKRKGGEEYGFGIELDGNLVGHISLMHLKDGNEPEIGYWIASNSSGRGVVTEATKAVTHFGLDKLSLKRIIIRAHPENIGSNSVAKKAGYSLYRQDMDDEGPLNVYEFVAD